MNQEVSLYLSDVTENLRKLVGMFKMDPQTELMSAISGDPNARRPQVPRVGNHVHTHRSL